MPEASQYSFSHKELVELMIKKTGLHEGKWMLLVTFGFGAVNSGPSPDQVMPTAVVGIQSVGIQKATTDAPESLTVDAGVVNPASSAKKRPSR
jgi:hypothetical protein